jgi:hypothetical protein
VGRKQSGYFLMSGLPQQPPFFTEGGSMKFRRFVTVERNFHESTELTDI